MDECQWVGPERRRKLDPDDARAVLQVLVEHLEQENYLDRSLQELRGVVGSVSGDLGQMKQAIADLREEVLKVQRGQAQATSEVNILRNTLHTHLDQAKPVIEASQAFLVLANAGSMLWRMKWWLITAVIALWALARFDSLSFQRAAELLFRIHVH